MAKIFRKARLSALFGERIPKYLLYAVGEIFLVVVGILIALSVNNWNQERKDHRREIQILENILKEITANSAVNARLITNRMNDKIGGLMMAKAYAQNELRITDTIDFLQKASFGAVFAGGYTYGSTNFFEEVLSTGELGLIRDITVRNLITDYYSRLEIYKERSNTHSSDFLKFINELRPFDTQNPDNISRYDQNEMMTAFKTTEFRKQVDMELSYAYKVRDYIHTIERTANSAIDLIQKNLDAG